MFSKARRAAGLFCFFQFFLPTFVAHGIFFALQRRARLRSNDAPRQERKVSAKALRTALSQQGDTPARAKKFTMLESLKHHIFRGPRKPPPDTIAECSNVAAFSCARRAGAHTTGKKTMRRFKTL